MKAAYGYIRVSTPGQRDKGVSLEAQKQRIAAWCTLNEYELREVFVDAGISGKRTKNRPGLKEALSTVTKRGDALVVYSLSRLARSTKDTIQIGERLEKSGADLVSLSERIDTTSAAGKMVFRMLAVLAEFESDIISERTILGMDCKRDRGESLGKIPFGSDLAGDGVTLVDNPGEQNVLQIIRRLRSEGESLRKIAAELTRRGIPTKEGKDTWTHTAVNRIVKRIAA